MKRAALLWLLAPLLVRAETLSPPSSGDVVRGKALFGQSCAICHTDGTEAPGTVKQGPPLAGVLGRKAGGLPGFAYTKSLQDSGLLWEVPALDRFLANPVGTVPGTSMPVAVADAGARADVIAYLASLKSKDAALPSPAPVSTGGSASGDPADWRRAAPGTRYRIDPGALPEPFATRSAGNGPKVVPRPEGAAPAVPPGFAAALFASGFTNPRVIRTAPNGDLFVAETAAKRIRVLRALEGAAAPSDVRIFAENLDRPFGIAFYPPGPEPKWVYVANNNSVVRFAYRNGDLAASGPPEIVVPKLEESAGGHTTRDIAFSLDGKRLFISVGSASNIGEGMGEKSPEEIAAWEKEHGRGAAWGFETNRALILVCDPEGNGLKTYATGIRNGVGIAVHPGTGDLWTSANERDGLGDDLVPDYVTRVKEGGFYGWPWYYIGKHAEPRLQGPKARPDLAADVIVPDVPVQAHSASLAMTFYPLDGPATRGPAAFPASYRGCAFAAFHGSWNRTTRTGYKVVRVFVKDGVPTGEYEDFLTGFVADDAGVWGRPVGVAVAKDGALLVTEDGNGTIWRIAPVK